MAEVKVQENTKEQKTGIAIGAAVLCGAACITLGYALGRKEMSATEHVTRVLIESAKTEGEQVLRWVNPDGSITRYSLQCLGNVIK